MELRPYVHAAQVFGAVVEEQPTAPALLWEPGRCTTYAQLDRLSNRFAWVLLEHGVHKRDTVALCLEKGPAAYAAILACLKIGAIYFAMDPANPPARLRSIADQCQPALAFVGASVPPGIFDGQTVAVSETEEEPACVAGRADGPARLPWEIDGSDPAYIMFTSGSTGVPKGVTISQANLIHFIRWARWEFGVGPGDVLTGLNPLFFDNSVFDFYASLCTGAALVPFGSATMRDPEKILSRTAELGCTVYFSVPSLLVYLQRLKLVGPGSFPSLRTIVFGGEGYPKPMLARLYEALGESVELCNVYGPTECTCICSVHRIRQADLADLSGYPPLGRLTPHFSGVIVGETAREVAPGETGELHLGGPCVGLGYYRAPELTAAAFIQNPTHQAFLDRVYKTGDLVRFDPGDGYLHFVGRTDTQIKHQGYRIELGEIEHALTSIDGVGEAAAVYALIDGVGRLMALVGADSDLSAARIKRSLAESLPKYMIPDRIAVVTTLPKNANGKIDRRQITVSFERGLL